MQETRVRSAGRLPGGGHDNPLQYYCLENPYGQRSLVGYSPWVHKESDTTERLNLNQIHVIWRIQSILHYTLQRCYLPMHLTWMWIWTHSHINLEKETATHSSILAWRIPMDRGAWWATVHSVAKSQTRLSCFTFTFIPNWFESNRNWLWIIPCVHS